MAEIWRETLYHIDRDKEIRGSSVLSDLQRRAFARPVDYLAESHPVIEAGSQPVGDIFSEDSANKYADIFTNRQLAISDGVLPHSDSRRIMLSPLAWGKKMGVVMIAISMFGLMYLTLPIAAAQVGSKLNQVSEERLKGVNQAIAESAPASQSQYPVLQEKSQFSTEELYRYKDFRIIIPKIGLESVIIKNVDPNNPSQYREQLANGVAQAMGSYLPGENGTMLLFAHSTDTVFDIAKYNAKFYAVRFLDIGDEISIRYGDKVYKYQIKDKKIISPNDLDKVRDSGYKLVLSTCYPPGTDWQRLVVFADPVVDN